MHDPIQKIDSVRFFPKNWLNPFSWDRVFDNKQPVEIDMGCGKGRFLLARAKAHPEINFFGMDRMLRRIRKIDRKTVRAGYENIQLFRMEAYYATLHLLPPESVTTVYIFFPDPWPKKKHHKRRLINSSLLSLIKPILKKHGRLFIATDWENYAEQIIELIACESGIINLAGENQYAPRPRWRPMTKFENRGLNKGHRVFDFALADKY